MRKGTQARHSFVERMIGVLSLREDIFREIIGDAGASQQAIRVLLIGSLGPAIGATFVLGLWALPFYFVVGSIVWCLYGALVYALGTRLFDAKDTKRNMAGFARGVAFAGLPRFIQVAGVGTILFNVLSVIAIVWTIATTIVAVRLSLNLNAQRAAGAAIVGAAVQFVIMALLLGG
jgi:hypothetical protein